MFAVFNRRSIQNKNVVPNILNPSIEAMPYFNSFCSFCSVRLGSIVVGILSLVNHTIFKPFSILMNIPKLQVQDIAPAFIMISMGPSWFSSFSKFTEDYIKDNGLDDRYLPDIRLIDKSSLQRRFSENFTISLINFFYLFIQIQTRTRISSLLRHCMCPTCWLVF